MTALPDSPDISHSPDIISEERWRHAFAVDLEQLLSFESSPFGATAAPTPVLPKVLLPLVAAYCTPSFADLLRYRSWIGSVFERVPAREYNRFSLTEFEFAYSFGIPPHPASVASRYFLLDTDAIVTMQCCGAGGAGEPEPTSAARAVYALLKTLIDAARESGGGTGTSDDGRHRTGRALSPPIHNVQWQVVAPRGFVLLDRFTGIDTLPHVFKHEVERFS